MNPHRTDLRHTARQRCKGTALLTVLFTLILALCTGFAVRPAHAEEPDATTNTDQAAKPGVSITVNSMTPVITPSSGYKLNLTVTNNTDADVDHGSIDALTNFTYNFISRTDRPACRFSMRSRRFANVTRTWPWCLSPTTSAWCRT